MKKNYLIYSLLIVMFGLINVTGAQGQSLWQRYKKHLVFSEEYDESTRFKIGLYLGTSTSQYTIKKIQDWEKESYSETGSFKEITPVSGLEFNLGIPFDYRINDNLNVTLSPGFSMLSQYHVNYSGNIDNIERYHRIESNSGDNFPQFDLPFTVKLRSEAKYLGQSRNAYKVYLLGGMRYSNYIGADNYYKGMDISTSNLPIIVKPSYYNYDLGLGLDIYFTYFKLSPEVRLSQSLGNLLDNNRNFPSAAGAYHNPFMDAIDRLSLRSVQFSLIFQ